MKQVQLIQITAEELINSISERVTKNILEAVNKEPILNTTPEDPLNDFITKSQAKDLLKVSPATLWRWEQSGKIKSYTLGSKRFYKRSELTVALTKLKK